MISFHGAAESPWFHDKELGFSKELMRYGWLGILPWGSRLDSPGAMGGIRECCSGLCDSVDCCVQGSFESLEGEMCAFWPGKADRDLALVDAIWQWLQDHTCVDRDKAGLHLRNVAGQRLP